MIQDILKKYLLPSPFPVILVTTPDDLERLAPSAVPDFLRHSVFMAVPGLNPTLATGQNSLPHHSGIWDALEWFYYEKEKAAAFLNPALDGADPVDPLLITPEPLKDNALYPCLYSGFFFCPNLGQGLENSEPKAKF